MRNNKNKETKKPKVNKKSENSNYEFIKNQKKVKIISVDYDI